MSLLQQYKIFITLQSTPPPIQLLKIALACPLVVWLKSLEEASLTETVRKSENLLLFYWKVWKKHLRQKQWEKQWKKRCGHCNPGLKGMTFFWLSLSGLLTRLNIFYFSIKVLSGIIQVPDPVFDSRIFRKLSFKNALQSLDVFQRQSSLQNIQPGKIWSKNLVKWNNNLHVKWFLEGLWVCNREPNPLPSDPQLHPANLHQVHMWRRSEVGSQRSRTWRCVSLFSW